MAGLMPREHGAYAQLGFPLLTGLVYSGGDPGAVAFAVAAVAVFLAHEPLAIRSGMRGARLQDQLGSAARRRLLFLAGVALAGALAAALLAPPRAWLAALVPAGLGLLLVPVLGTRGIKSVRAELVAAAAFAAAVLPLALSAPDVTPFDAGLAAVVWFLAIVPAIYAVHAIKAAVRRRPGEVWVIRVAPPVAAAVAVTAAASARFLPGADDLHAALVPVLASLVITLRLPHPRHLKRVGWAMVTADSAALVLLLVL